MVQDGDVVAFILAGNPRGLNLLLARLGHTLAEYVRVFTCDDDELFGRVYEDVLVGILRGLKASHGRRDGQLRRYAFQAAARTLRKHYPKLVDAPPSEERRMAPIAVIEDIGSPSRNRIIAALRALSARERELLMLRFRLGFGYGEISDIIKEARVRFEDRLLTARGYLRAALLTASDG